MYSIIDPRIKALSDSKYKEFRSWFDQRLDDAIAAAEAQEDGSNSTPIMQGKIIPTKTISEYILFSYSKLTNIFYFFINFFCLGVLTSFLELIERLYSGMICFHDIFISHYEDIHF